jgi:predicted transcriptional regulator
MAYELSPDINARVQARLATGEFSTPEEVLREALDTLERRQVACKAPGDGAGGGRGYCFGTRWAVR